MTAFTAVPKNTWTLVHTAKGGNGVTIHSTNGCFLQVKATVPTDNPPKGIPLKAGGHVSFSALPANAKVYAFTRKPGDVAVEEQAELATASALDISAAATVKATPGRVHTVSVVTAGAAGALHDVAAHASAAAANKVATIPAAVGVYPLNWPCLLGISVVPGAGQVVAVSYS